MREFFVFTGLALCALGACGGTATYSFSWYRNAPVTDFPVPLVLEEGRNGFTYSGSDGACGLVIR